jgi:hypothetical protein
MERVVPAVEDVPSYTEGFEPDLGDKGYRKWQTLLTPLFNNIL